MKKFISQYLVDVSNKEVTKQCPSCFMHHLWTCSKENWFKSAAFSFNTRLVDLFLILTKPLVNFLVPATQAMAEFYFIFKTNGQFQTIFLNLKFRFSHVCFVFIDVLIRTSCPCWLIWVRIDFWQKVFYWIVTNIPILVTSTIQLTNNN